MDSTYDPSALFGYLSKEKRWLFHYVCQALDLRTHLIRNLESPFAKICFLKLNQEPKDELIVNPHF